MMNFNEMLFEKMSPNQHFFFCSDYRHRMGGEEEGVGGGGKRY